MADVKVRIGATNNASGTISKVEGDLRRMGDVSGRLKEDLIGMGAAWLSIDQGAQIIGEAVREYIAFEKSIAAIGTLIPGQTQQIKLLSDQAERLSVAYGLAAEDVAGATFQAVSAGVAAKDAAAFMDVAARTAVAGMTNMTTAVDGLTNVMMSYGLSAKETAQVADAFFVANAKGKTTAEELSASIGTVASMAAQLGVSYQEVLSATVALTNSGVSTAESMVGIRAILASLLQPSEEAKKVSAELGIAWDANVLRAKGLTGALVNLREATERGGQEAVSQLVPRVEGLSKAMTLASETGMKQFSDALTEMTTKAGQTDEALQEVTTGGAFLFEQQMQKLKATGRDVGETSLPVINTALKLFTDTIQDALGALSGGDGLVMTLAKLIPVTTGAAWTVDLLRHAIDGLADTEEQEAKIKAKVAEMATRRAAEEAKETEQRVATIRVEKEEELGLTIEVGRKIEEAKKTHHARVAAIDSGAADERRRRMEEQADLELAMIDMQIAALERAEDRRRSIYAMVEEEGPEVTEMQRAAREREVAAEVSQVNSEKNAKVKEKEADEIAGVASNLQSLASITERVGAAAEVGSKEFADSVQRMSAAERATVVVRSALLAAFETAEAIRSFASYEYMAGALHAAAAVQYAAIAGGTAVGGFGGSSRGGSDSRRSARAGEDDGPGVYRSGEASGQGGTATYNVTMYVQGSVIGAAEERRTIRRATADTRAS